MKFTPLILPLAALLAATLPLSAHSAPAKAARQTVAGPAASITLISGQVDVRAGGKNAARPAQMNAPLAAHTLITTAARGQTEIRIGSSVLRLDAESELEITRLDATSIKLNLHYGSAFARVSDDMARQFELGTAQGHITLQEAGEVRVDAASAPDTSAVRLFTGNARFTGNDGNNINVQSGTQLALRGGNISTTPLMTDEFDDWCLGTQRQPRTVQAAAPYPASSSTVPEWRHDGTQAISSGETVTTYYPEPVYATTQVQTVVREDYSPWVYAPLYVGAWIWLNHAWYWDRGARGYYHGGYVGGYHGGVHPGYPHHTAVTQPRPAGAATGGWHGRGH